MQTPGPTSILKGGCAPPQAREYKTIPRIFLVLERSLLGTYRYIASAFCLLKLWKVVFKGKLTPKNKMYECGSDCC